MLKLLRSHLLSNSLLKTGCVLIALYTVLLGTLLLFVSLHDNYATKEFHFPAAITIYVLNFVSGAALILAGLCLLAGVLRDSRRPHTAWLIIVAIYIVYQIAIVPWNIQSNMSAYVPIPATIRPSTHVSNMVVFGCVFFVNVACFTAVHTHRGIISAI